MCHAAPLKITSPSDEVRGYSFGMQTGLFPLGPKKARVIATLNTFFECAALSALSVEMLQPGQENAILKCILHFILPLKPNSSILFVPFDSYPKKLMFID